MPKENEICVVDSSLLKIWQRTYLKMIKMDKC
ncbi:hypothetical protein Thewi_2659 [Thermoanaerobacter wiegelii Rt8.B1]|uniref:Uncharacterized protein n=1 Tax=Thermoanaerobacter wiegelii Rt8.B1 TaxID=697303 RepID=G2MUF6_9THEO|nr:hypothetical protein Thewi_2659 [Thermoanaerobacter wiegelii Rt8.B1]